MRLTSSQLSALAQMVLAAWKKAGLITFKASEDVVLKRMIAALNAEVQKEADLDREVTAMLDKLEQSNPGEFQRHKMFNLMKQKLAKERKVIL